jgi:hypothetical protein
MLAIDGTAHLLFNVFNKILCSFILINQNIDLLSYSLVVADTEIINACLNIIDIFLPIILIDVTALKYSQEAFVLFQAIL